MGNTFGNYATRAKAAEALYDRGFGLCVEEGYDEYFRKPSTNGVTGEPQMAIVKIIEQRVDPIYGQPNYFQHEYI